MTEAPQSTPSAAGYRMPAEWEPHARTWIAWPCRARTFGGDEALAAARETTVRVARTLVDHEPVTCLCNPDDVAEASLRLGQGVEVLPMPLDDSWLRDTGPSFVVGPAGEVAGIDWRFNGWGGLNNDFAQDAEIARQILERRKLHRFAAPIVLEGGSIHVDGEGTLITTEECLLDPARNGGLSKAEMEAALKAHTGASVVIWLGLGYDEDETRGHIDEVAAFVRPGVVVMQGAEDPDDPNQERFRDNLARLSAARDARGRDIEVIELPSAARRERNGRRLTLSYANFYIANGVVLVPQFEDAADREAVRLFRNLFPDREVEPVDALDIVAGGGGLHCITQQQPAPPEVDSST